MAFIMGIQNRHYNGFPDFVSTFAAALHIPIVKQCDVGGYRTFPLVGINRSPKARLKAEGQE